MKGGRILVNNNGTFYGRNPTGRADARFLNALGIRWHGDGAPPLTELYRYPDSLTDGFNFSILDAIFKYVYLEDYELLFGLLDNMLKARETDAVKYHLQDVDVHEGHAYVYGLTKWLRVFYFPSWLPEWHELWNFRDSRYDEHYQNVYKHEFINTYERNINLHYLTRDERRRVRNIVSKWRNFSREEHHTGRRRTGRRRTGRRRGGSKKRAKIQTRKNRTGKCAVQNTKKLPIND